MRAYLDHAATTPTRPEAVAAMLPWWRDRWGNPTGTHAAARRARDAVDEAREVMAAALGFEPAGIVWTSGGTESDNLALRARPKGCDGPGALVVSAVEHAAVLEPARHSGAEVRVAPVGPDGLLDLEVLGRLLDRDVAVVSVMTVNNETGVIQPLDAVADLVRRRAPGAVVHTDAVQALGWMDLTASCATVDAVSVSGHKVGGPQGVGVLALRPGIEPVPLLRGGAQERERRAGTPNVAGAVGMAAAVSAAVAAREAEVRRLEAQRDRLVAGVLAGVPGSRRTAGGVPCGPGFAHLRFEGVESEALVLLLDEAGVEASAGASCASGAMEASHVLVAMGLDEVDALSSLRLTLGHTTTDADVDLAVTAVTACVAQLRSS